MRPRYWHGRALLVLSVLTSLLITWAEPEALAHRVITRTGQVGWVCVAALAGVCLVALLDVLVNDVLPDAIQWHRCKRWRHLVYMALALGLMCISGVIASSEGWTELLLHYWLSAAFAAHMAATDLFHRHRSPHA